MSFEEQLEQSSELASLRSQLHGDRGSATLAFGGGAGPATVTKAHKLGVVPGVVNVMITNDPGVVVVITAAADAAQIVFTGRGAAAVGTNPVFTWEARA